MKPRSESTTVTDTRASHRDDLPLFLRWLKYNSVGWMGFGLQLLTLSLLTSVVGLHYLNATALAVEIAILHNFLWHENWTWSDRGSPNRAVFFRRLLTFNATSGTLSIAGNLAFMYLFVGSLGMKPLPANVLSVACCSLLNFALNHGFVFRTMAREGRA